MRLHQLRVSHIRNLIAVELSFTRINVVYGCNGSGKTSLLEAVALLGSGRSFRTNRVETLITHGQDRCTVFGVVGASGLTLPMGVSRHRQGRLEAQVQGNRVASSARLAENLPLLSINSASFGLVESGPQARRQFMDWGVFHVEHQFHPAWLAAQRALKQRNMLLRRGKILPAELAAWDARLCEAGEAMDRMRGEWFQRFEPLFQQTLTNLEAPFELELRYFRGWEAGTPLDQALHRTIEVDQRRGHTGVGPHRADIRMRVQGSNAAETLSRGQQKLVVIALKLAQGQLLLRAAGKQSVYLVDDLPAELDAHYRRVLCVAMVEQGAQVLTTCVDPHDLDGCWAGLQPNELELFHVERGQIQA